MKKSKRCLLLQGGILLSLTVFSSCAVQDEKAPAPPKPPAEAKAPSDAPASEAKQAPQAKAKPVKAKGDVGLLELEKNYMILVTKEGKLITLDFTDKTKVSRINPTEAKIEDIGLGSSATVEFQSSGDTKTITKIEYRAAKTGE